MAAVFTINQATLAAPGAPNTARDDGLAGGQLVTLLSTAHELSYEFDLLWVGIHPTPDTTSRASLQPAGAGAVSFSPTGGVYGTWRIELVTDRGTPAEDRAEAAFSIKQSPLSLRIPAANERSDPEASLQKNGAAYLARSTFNAPDGVINSPFAAGTYVSHYRAVADLIYRAGEPRVATSALTGTVHNLAPSTAAGRLGTLLLTAAAPASLTGIKAPEDDTQRVRLDVINFDAQAITLKNNDAGSLLANRLVTFSGSDLVLSANGGRATLVHIPGGSWRVVPG